MENRNPNWPYQLLVAQAISTVTFNNDDYIIEKVIWIDPKWFIIVVQARAMGTTPSSFWYISYVRRFDGFYNSVSASSERGQVYTL